MQLHDEKQIEGQTLLQTKVLRIIFFNNRSYPSDELFERSCIMNAYDFYVCERLIYAVHSTRGKIDKNVETLFSHKSSSIFTRSNRTNIFHVPQLRLEVHRQSLKYRGTLLLNYHPRKKYLPPHYEKCESRELSKYYIVLYILHQSKLNSSSCSSFELGPVCEIPICRILQAGAR